MYMFLCSQLRHANKEHILSVRTIYLLIDSHSACVRETQTQHLCPVTYMHEPLFFEASSELTQLGTRRPINNTGNIAREQVANDPCHLQDGALTFRCAVTGASQHYLGAGTGAQRAIAGQFQRYGSPLRA